MPLGQSAETGFAEGVAGVWVMGKVKKREKRACFLAGIVGLYTPFSRHLRQTRAKRKDNRSLKNEIRSNASRMGLDPEGMRQLKCLCRANTVKGLFGGPHETKAHAFVFV